MSAVLLMSLVLLGVAVASTWTGWAWGVLFNVPILRRRTLDARVLCALVGTGTIILIAGTFAHLGLSMRQIRWVGGGLEILLLAGAVWREPWRNDWFQPSWPLAGLLLACTMALGIFSFIIYQGGMFPIANDGFTYLSLSHWLQDHGFRTFGDIDPEQPLTLPARFYHRQEFRMGSTFLLGLTQSSFSYIDPLLVYTAVTIWGFLANLLALYLVGRWVLQFTRGIATLCLLFVAVGANPLRTTLFQGFQPQLFGTAYLLLSLALLSRARSKGGWQVSRAGLIALAVCTTLSIYSEFAPILALIAVGYLLLSIKRGRRQAPGRFYRFAAMTVLLLGLMGHIEWLRALHALRIQLGVIVGVPLPWPLIGFWAFAMGIVSFREAANLLPLAWLMMASATFVFFVGATRVLRRPQAVLLVLVLTIFSLLAGYFAFAPNHSTTITLGHRWSLYKTAKWAYPFVVVAQFAGLAFLTQRIRVPQALQLGNLPPLLQRLGLTHSLLILLCLANFAWSLESFQESAIEARAFAISLGGSDRPGDLWRQVRSRLDSMGVRKVYYVCEQDEHIFPHAMVTTQLYPRPIVNGWENRWLRAVHPFDPHEPIPSDAAFLTMEPPCFDPPAERLAGRVTLLGSHKPWVIKLENPSGVLEPTPGGAKTRIGCVPASLVVWSPRAGTARFSCELQAEAGMRDVTTHQVRIAAPTIAPRTIDFIGTRRLEVDIPLPAGLSRIEVRSLDRMVTPKGAIRESQVWLQGVQLNFLGGTHPGAPELAHHDEGSLP